jgi:hypothetical protein
VLQYEQKYFSVVEPELLISITTELLSLSFIILFLTLVVKAQ